MDEMVWWMLFEENIQGPVYAPRDIFMNIIQNCI